MKHDAWRGRRAQYEAIEPLIDDSLDHHHVVPLIVGTGVIVMVLAVGLVMIALGVMSR